jgi:hypothetical protein
MDEISRLTNNGAIPMLPAVKGSLVNPNEREERSMAHQAAITAGHREAGDSLDFHVRHGRALQARAARECTELLLMLFRSWRRRRGAPRRGWQVEWPVEPQGSHCGRP